MKRSASLTLAAALLFVLSSGLVQAQEGSNPPGQASDGAGKRRRGGVDLGLTDAQKADLRQSAETTRHERVQKSADLRQAKQDLRSLLRAETVDETAVNAKLAEVQAAQGALMKLRIDSVLAMKRILTPEQQKKMAERREHRGEKVRHRIEKRRELRSKVRRHRHGAVSEPSLEDGGGAYN
jgi:periplasmic protein CpxP/Spy